MENKLVHLISHTDLDGVVGAALAWHIKHADGLPVRVSLTGYGEVDNLILETFDIGQEPLVIDLFCQRRETVDKIDRIAHSIEKPFLFDHHKTTLEAFGNRPWAVIQTDMCGAAVYHRWLEGQNLSVKSRAVHRELEELVTVANDRDLWLGQIPDSRLWHAIVTLLGPAGTLARLVSNPDANLSARERALASDFVTRQEERFIKAMGAMSRTANLAFLGPDYLEFGDVSDFCGLVMDRDGTENPPLLVAVAARRYSGDWAVSMRSRNGLAGNVVGLLKDGRKIRGGGHGDAAALYFPTSYKEEQIAQTLLAAISTEAERSRPVGVTLGDIFGALGESGKQDKAPVA